MKTLITNIATIHSGIYAKPDLEGEVFYVQAKHFNSAKEFDASIKPDLHLEGKIIKHLLKTGDILLAAKGNNNFAVHFKGMIKPAVASSIFIVIRIKDQRAILPEFITWFLNLHSTQTHFKNSSKGSALQSLTKNEVEQFEIAIPTLEKQQAIIKFYNLRKLERSISKQLDNLKEQEIQHLLLTKLK